MRIMYLNKMLNATVTGSAQSNFGLANMFISSLSIPFMGIDISSQLVITLDAVTDVNCIAVAGHNLSSLRYRIYDDTDTIVEDVLTVSVDKSEVLYLSGHLIDGRKSYACKKIVLDLVAVSGYTTVGHMMVGEYLDMPNPNAYYPEKKIYTASREETVLGQVYGSMGVFLQTYDLNFVNVSNVKFVEISNMLESRSNFHPLFVDMTALNHNVKPALYATVNASEFNNATDGRGLLTHSFSLNIQEVR